MYDTSHMTGSPHDTTLISDEEAEVLELIRANKLNIQEFIQKLNNAVPMAGEYHILQVAMWDDRLFEMRDLLTRIIKGTK